MNTKKIIFMILSVISSTFLFTLLNNGDIIGITAIIQPFLFALTFSINIFLPISRKFFLITSLILLIIMIFVYFLNLLEISNWIGSLGFGMLLMTTFSYLPNFIRKGYLEKY